jgi:RNA polymerase sigma-70 factor (ECF subfamily)
VDAREQKESGDYKAVLEQAYEQNAGNLYRYALMILANPEVAKDVVQQVFTNMMKMGKRLLEIESSNDYLRTAVRNECYSIIKKMQRFDGRVKQLSAEPILEKLDNEIITENEQKLIEETIQALPPEQREVLHMKVYEGRTFKEISETINVSVNTASSRYRYAIDKLKEVLILDDED